MPTGRLIYVGTDVEALRPHAVRRENGRLYHMPKIGYVAYRVRHPDLDGADVETFGPLPAASAYSMLVIEDFTEKFREVLYGQEWQARLLKGIDRANDLAREWHSYGVALIAGDTPTEAELQRARGQRRSWLDTQVTNALRSFRASQQGKPGISEFNGTQLEMFRELGRVAPTATENLQKASVDENANRVPCYFCAELIIIGARKCRYCGETQPAREEVLA